MSRQASKFSTPDRPYGQRRPADVLFPPVAGPSYDLVHMQNNVLSVTFFHHVFSDKCFLFLFRFSDFSSSIPLFPFDSYGR